MDVNNVSEICEIHVKTELECAVQSVETRPVLSAIFYKFIISQ